MTKKSHFPKIELCDHCKAKLQRHIDLQQQREKQIHALLRKARDSALTHDEKKTLHALLTDMTNQSGLH